MNNKYIKASSDYAFNYAEHLVKKKTDRKTVLARIGIIFLALVLSLVIVFITSKVPYVTAVAITLMAYVIIVLWRQTKIEFEYLIVSGSLTMDKIIALKKRKQIADIKLPEAEAILPYADAKLDGIPVTFAVTTPSAEDAYCIIYKSEGGNKKALVFNTNEKTLKMLKYYNKNCVIK